ncbi:GAP1-N2 domain-containing protein [Brevibacillus migulae]|uniref:GAP1-N2 domain-containing protein n=1 Tax=Brevibacillus migulae TaxID=1644114 RepID=UPI00106EB7A5|nr:hypothetical protein [Brevibacillus migulae]
MRQPILQQYYTRAREGVFRTNEGYDTIAKTPQLENSFIKKTLHPFCSYDAPKELQERSEKDLTQYPQALLLFYSESGEMVLGQSAYVGADFTGQRNTFFSHNYVIPPSRQEEYWKHPAKIAGAAGFVTQYDPSSGKSLPELEDIPYRDRLAGSSAKRMLQQLGIEEMTYKRLLAAVMTAVAGKKKVFVVPSCDVSGMAEWARVLLQVVYAGLPYAHRRRFGFLTYMSEPESRKHLHLMVVPPGSLRPGDAAIDKEFQFDFAANRFSHAELAGGIPYYLDFVWEHLDEAEELDRYFLFAEEVLAGADPAKALGLPTYHELAVLYLTERGKAYPYEQNKAAMHHLLVQYLGIQGLPNKARLHALFGGLFLGEKQALAAGQLPAIETVKAVIDYASLVAETQDVKEYLRYVLEVVIRGYERGESGWMEEIYGHAQRDAKLFRPLMMSIMTSEQLAKPLFLDYLDKRLLAVKDVNGLLEELAFWLKRVPPLREYRAFFASMAKRVDPVMKAEPDQVGSILRLHKRVEESGVSPQAAAEFLDAADAAMLRTLPIEKLAVREISQLGALLQEKPKHFAQNLDWTSRQKLELLATISQLWEEPQALSVEDVFEQMDQDTITQLQGILLRQLREADWEESVYTLLPFAFYREEGECRYDPMLRFVLEQGGREGLPGFVQWSLRQEEFVTGMRLKASYRQALKSHFLLEDRDALRKKATRLAWYAIRHTDLQRLLEEVRDETANGLVRFFRKPAGKTVIIMTGLLGIGAIGAAVMLGMQKSVPVEEQPPVDQPIPAAPVYYGPPIPQQGGAQPLSPTENGSGDSVSPSPELQPEEQKQAPSAT